MLRKVVGLCQLFLPRWTEEKNRRWIIFCQRSFCSQLKQYIFSRVFIRETLSKCIDSVDKKVLKDKTKKSQNFLWIDTNPLLKTIYTNTHYTSKHKAAFQTLANRGHNSRFVLEAIFKPLIPKSSRSSIMITLNPLEIFFIKKTSPAGIPTRITLTMD